MFYYIFYCLFFSASIFDKNLYVYVFTNDVPCRKTGRKTKGMAEKRQKMSFQYSKN